MQEDSGKHDNILDFTIYYDGSYPDGLTKEKKRSVRKRTAKLETEKGEVFLLRKGKSSTDGEGAEADITGMPPRSHFWALWCNDTTSLWFCNKCNN